MTKTALTVLLCLIATPNLGVGESGFHLHVDVTKLQNGLTLLTCVDSSASTVSYQTFINAGSRDETKPGATGLAHVFEHMMFRGTALYPDFDDAVSFMGPETNGYTTDDYTCYFVNAKPEFLEKIIEVESDRVQNLSFSQEAFRRELGPVKEERRRGVDDDPGGFLYQELYKLAFTRHTYRHPVIGWEEDLEKNMTYEDAHEFKKTFYAPNYCTIVISGKFDPNLASELVLKHYGTWQPSLPPVSQVSAEPEQRVSKRKDFRWKDRHVPPRLLLGYRGPDLNYDTPDFVALKVLSNVLFSKTGRLYKKLHVDSDLVERIGGEVDGRKDPGLIVIDASLRDDVGFDSILAVIRSELTSLATTELSPSELELAVNPMKADYLFRLDRPSRIGGQIGYYHLVGGDYKMIFEHYETLSSITPSDIRAAAAKYLTENASTVVTLSPAALQEGR
jgi:zinc protease